MVAVMIAGVDLTSPINATVAPAVNVSVYLLRR